MELYITLGPNPRMRQDPDSRDQLTDILYATSSKRTSPRAGGRPLPCDGTGIVAYAESLGPRKFHGNLSLGMCLGICVRGRMRCVVARWLRGIGTDGNRDCGSASRRRGTLLP
jgi:hypothetical protein